MDLPLVLAQASRRGRLFALWGASPFPLAARPPANRALAINQWAAGVEALPPPEIPLSELPPLPILSLDPSQRVEGAFAHAGVPLQVVSSRRIAPARGPSAGSEHGRHVLLKLAGDLATRSGVVLSRTELGELRSDSDKRHLLDEARRLVGDDGALLLLGCDPADEDFRAWWSVLATALRDADCFALGEPSAAWPEGMMLLEMGFEALKAGLWAVQPEPEVAQPSTPPRSEAGKYIINVYGPVEGLTIGDQAQVEQHFGEPPQTAQGDWETLIAQVTARLEGLGTQLDQGVADLKRGQGVLYRQVDRAYRDDLARVLAAVQLGRIDQIEMGNTLDTLQQAMQLALREGLPMDAELRAAVADLTEAVESHLSLERKLELALPLLPLLTYKIELGVGSEVDLHDLWDELRMRWQRLVERYGH